MRLGVAKSARAFTLGVPRRVASLIFGSGFLSGSSFVGFYFLKHFQGQAKADGANGMHMYIVRHGESEGNVDLNAYRQYGDHRLPLTEDGKLMAQKAGRYLADRFEQIIEEDEDPWIEMWVSPFTRTRETAIEMLKGGLGQWVQHVRESPHLVEQDWGLLEGQNIKAEEVYEHFPKSMKRIRLQANAEGKFYARFPSGESAADVYNRVTNFVGTIQRRKHKYTIVVTHGITGRALIMRMLHHTPEWFESSVNLPNASVYEISNTPFPCGKSSWEGKFIYGGFGKGGLQDEVELCHLNDVNERCTWRSMESAMTYEKYLLNIGAPRVFENVKRPCKVQSMRKLNPDLEPM